LSYIFLKGFFYDVGMSTSLINTNLKVVLHDDRNLQSDNNVGKKEFYIFIHLVTQLMPLRVNSHRTYHSFCQNDNILVIATNRCSKKKSD